MNARPALLRGFTLVELVLVIVIVGVLAVVTVPIILTPFAAFRDTERRARLVAEAEQGVLRVMRELRHALPNSVRLDGDEAVEFLNTMDGGRYRRYRDLSSTPPGGDELEIPGSDSGFDVLAGAETAAAGQWLVVYNTDANANVATNAYRGGNRSQVTGLSGGVLSFSAHAFPTHSPSQRFDLVDGPVTFECLWSTDHYRLQRCSGYSIQATQYAVGNCPGTEELILDDLSACAFSYVVGASSRSGVLTLSITRDVADDRGGVEQIPLVAQAQVWNAP